MRYFRVSISRWCGEFVCGRITPEFHAHFFGQDNQVLSDYILGDETARDPAVPAPGADGRNDAVWFDFDDVAHISEGVLQHNYIHVTEATPDGKGGFSDTDGGKAVTLEIGPHALAAKEGFIALSRRVLLDETDAAPADPAIMIRSVEKGSLTSGMIEDKDGFDAAKLRFVVIDFQGDLVIDEAYYGDTLLELELDSSTGKGMLVSIGALTEQTFDPPVPVNPADYFEGPPPLQRADTSEAPGSVFAPEELVLPAGVPPLPEEGYTNVDRWAWARILDSGSADFHARFGTDGVNGNDRALLTGVSARQRAPHLPMYDADGEILPDADEGGEDKSATADLTPDDVDAAWHHRTLSSDFLNQILCREPWRSAIDSQAIDITGARLRTFLDRGCTHGIILDACLIPDDALFASNTFDGPFFMRNCTVIGKLSFMHCQFAQSPKFEGVWAAVIDFSDAKVSGSVQIASCVFDSGADFMDMKAASSLVLNGTAIHGDIDADRLELGGSLLARHMPRITNFDLVSATIGGSADLTESRIEGLLDMTNARIQRELRLSTKDRGPTEWGPNARFALRNAETHALQASLDALRVEAPKGKRKLKRRFVPTDLGGFRFQAFGGMDSEDTDTLADAHPSLLRGWIESRPNFHKRYTPTPYHAFADALRVSGYADKASALMVAKNKHRLRAGNTPLLMRFTIWLSGIISGFGQRNHRALFWFVLLAFVGAGAGLIAEGWSPLARDALPPSWDEWLRASVDNAAPIVEFSAESGDAPAQLLGQAMPSWLAGLWFGISIFGFVVLSYLLAGISGLFDRGES